ncbi:MAG: hypothetical protein WC325_07210 [Candidatus Bathyarchaeia archaeon]
MVRPIEKLVKLQQPKDLTKLTVDTIEVFPATLRLDLPNLEPCTETPMTVHIELGLDQLETDE